MPEKIGNQNDPQAEAIEALALFWDNHDLTDYEQQLEAVEGPVFERQPTMTVRQARPEAEAAKKMAESRGAGDGEPI